jgi:hypothetical protein
MTAALDQLRRDLLRQGNRPLSLEEICSFSQRFFGQPDHLSLYGLAPREYCARGITLLARSAIECVPDAAAEVLAREARRCWPAFSRQRPTVVDLFLGTGNLLYHCARELDAVRRIGIERDAIILQTARDNLAKATRPGAVQVEHELLETAEIRPEISGDCLVIVDPPWGDGFSLAEELDLRRTQPPVLATLRATVQLLAGGRLLFLIKIPERVAADSLAELEREFEPRGRGIARIGPVGTNVGWLFCTPRSPGQ